LQSIQSHKNQHEVSLKDFIKIFKTDELGENFVRVINEEVVAIKRNELRKAEKIKE